MTSDEMVYQKLWMELQTLQRNPGGLEGILSEAGPPPQTEPERAAATPLQTAGHGTILLVDDEELVCDLTRRMLERLGFRVLTARDGQAALHTFRAHRDEVVCALLDLTMPGMDGAETLRELRQIRPDLPAIVSSGYDRVELDNRLAGAERCEFVQKPYELAALRGKLNAVVRSDGS